MVCLHFQKRRLRLSALDNSTSIPPERKKKCKEVMQNDYMSSEHSMSEDDVSEQNESGSDSDTEQDVPKARKFSVNKLTWRSGEVDNLFKALDKKVLRKQHAQGKRMRFERCAGVVSPRTAPLDAPAWAIKKP